MSTVKSIPSQQVQQNVMIKSESLLSEMDYLFGKKRDESKVIDVKSKQDFPTLIPSSQNSGG